MKRTKDLFLEIQQELANEITQVENGELSYLDALLSFRQAKAHCEQIVDTIKQFEEQKSLEIETEVNKWGGKYHGAKIEYRNGGLSYDFSKIEEYQQVKNNLKEIEEKYKIAYQNKLKGLATFDQNTGEELQIPEATPRKSSLIVKL